MKRTKLLLMVAAAVAVVWFTLAVQAGLFLPNDTQIGRPVADEWSATKKFVTIGSTPVAYVEAGPIDAPPLVLLHGCPFSSVIWRDVLPALAKDHHVIAPDLLGLGDTRVTLADDYRLHEDAELMVKLLDQLGIARADFVTTDHGGAVLQLLMGLAPQRIGRAVITNAEAYSSWPSDEERPYLEAVVHPVAGPIFKALLSFTVVRREVFSIATADPRSLDDAMLNAFVESHTSSPERWQRLVRFYRWQLDPEHQAETTRAVPAMRAFPRPVLVLWGAADGNFGPAIAERLTRDFPAGRLEWIERAGHLPMVEQPARYVASVTQFLAEERP